MIYTLMLRNRYLNQMWGGAAGILFMLRRVSGVHGTGKDTDINAKDAFCRSVACDPLECERG